MPAAYLLLPTATSPHSYESHNCASSPVSPIAFPVRRINRPRNEKSKMNWKALLKQAAIAIAAVYIYNTFLVPRIPALPTA